MSERESGPGGYVVVSFGSEADRWCSLNKCPMGLVQWFPTREEGKRYADSLPDAFEPHILMVEDGV